jgi:hypothetical protein
MRIGGCNQYTSKKKSHFRHKTCATKLLPLMMEHNIMIIFNDINAILVDDVCANSTKTETKIFRPDLLSFFALEDAKQYGKQLCDYIISFDYYPKYYGLLNT